MFTTYTTCVTGFTAIAVSVPATTPASEMVLATALEGSITATLASAFSAKRLPVAGSTAMWPTVLPTSTLVVRVSALLETTATCVPLEKKARSRKGSTAASLVPETATAVELVNTRPSMVVRVPFVSSTT